MIRIFVKIRPGRLPIACSLVIVLLPPSETKRAGGDGLPLRLDTLSFPALRPTVVVVLVLTIVHSIKVFDLVVGMTGGGPAQSSQVLALWSYSKSFLQHDFGMGNAVATVLLAITLVLVVPYLIWSTKGNED